MNPLFPSALLCALFTVTPGLQADPSPSSTPESESAFPAPKNAALTYWQAFALMPQLTEENKEFLRNMIGPRATEAPKPFDKAAAEKLLAEFSTSFDLYEKATRLPHCDWELDYSRGMNLSLPHLSKLLDLTKASLLRVRLRVHQGDFPGALTDLQSALRACYQVSSGPPLIIENLVQISMESLCLHAVAADFSRWHKASLEELEKTLNSLPRRNTTLEALKMERKIFLSDLPSYLSQYKDMEDQSGSTAVTLEQFAKRLLADPVRLQKASKQLDADFRELIRLHELPYREAHCKVDEFFQQLAPKDGKHTLSFFILPSVNAILTKEMIASIQFTMLKAAIAIRLRGPEALAQYPDPFDGKPFQYERKGDGFTLTSELRYKDKPFSIHFR